MNVLVVWAHPRPESFSRAVFDRVVAARRRAGCDVEVIDLYGHEQVLWPDHCVQHSHGAELVDALDTSKIDHIFHKGTDREIDSYSTFFDNAHLKSTGLSDYLKEKGVREIYLLGLATDYCVKFSALDARHLGFDTYVIADACRAVELDRKSTRLNSSHT